MHTSLAPAGKGPSAKGRQNKSIRIQVEGRGPAEPSRQTRQEAGKNVRSGKSYAIVK